MSTLYIEMYKLGLTSEAKWSVNPQQFHCLSHFASNFEMILQKSQKNQKSGIKGSFDKSVNRYHPIISTSGLD